VATVRLDGCFERRELGRIKEFVVTILVGDDEDLHIKVCVVGRALAKVGV
jgi:hypothetical protein